MHARQKLGQELADLGLDSLRRLPVPENVFDAILEFQRLKTHESRRRQMQYIGKLMRDADYDGIRDALDILTGASRASVVLMHECEHLRDQLLASDDALGPFLEAHPGVDTQWLRAKLRAARLDREHGKPPKNSRELYRWLHQVLQKAEQTNEDNLYAPDQPSS